ncbi:hypothetical protein WS98_25400 [Burkholderia territorii]|nr:hypothetical protein WS98_25400 [Burkholderia territorii]
MRTVDIGGAFDTLFDNIDHQDAVLSRDDNKRRNILIGGPAKGCQLVCNVAVAVIETTADLFDKLPVERQVFEGQRPCKKFKFVGHAEGSTCT